MIPFWSVLKLDARMRGRYVTLLRMSRFMRVLGLHCASVALQRRYLAKLRQETLKVFLKTYSRTGKMNSHTVGLLQDRVEEPFIARLGEAC